MKHLWRKIRTYFAVFPFDSERDSDRLASERERDRERVLDLERSRDLLIKEIENKIYTKRRKKIKVQLSSTIGLVLLVGSAGRYSL